MTNVIIRLDDSRSFKTLFVVSDDFMRMFVVKGGILTKVLSAKLALFQFDIYLGSEVIEEFDVSGIDMQQLNTACGLL
jgi:hypothetical protein